MAWQLFVLLLLRKLDQSSVAVTRENVGFPLRSPVCSPLISNSDNFQ